MFSGGVNLQKRANSVVCRAIKMNIMNKLDFVAERVGFYLACFDKSLDSCDLGHNLLN